MESGDHSVKCAKETTVLFCNESSDMQFFCLLVLSCFHIFKTDQMGFSRHSSISLLIIL